MRQGRLLIQTLANPPNWSRLQCVILTLFLDYDHTSLIMYQLACPISHISPAYRHRPTLLLRLRLPTRTQLRPSKPCTRINSIPLRPSFSYRQSLIKLSTNPLFRLGNLPLWSFPGCPRSGRHGSIRWTSLSTFKRACLEARPSEAGNVGLMNWQNVRPRKFLRLCGVSGIAG